MALYRASSGRECFSDGRYRFILYDLDTCLRSKPDQFSELMTKDSWYYSELLDFLLKYPGYREKFICNVLNLTNTTWSPESLCSRLSKEKKAHHPKAERKNLVP